MQTNLPDNLSKSSLRISDVRRNICRAFTALLEVDRCFVDDQRIKFEPMLSPVGQIWLAATGGAVDAMRQHNFSLRETIFATLDQSPTNILATMSAEDDHAFRSGHHRIEGDADQRMREVLAGIMAGRLWGIMVSPFTFEITERLLVDPAEGSLVLTRADLDSAVDVQGIIAAARQLVDGPVSRKTIARTVYMVTGSNDNAQHA
jgi:hypothetical protein